MRLRIGVAIGLLLLLTARGASAQSFQGGLRGAIKDSGGVVPGVEVTLAVTAGSSTLGQITSQSGFMRLSQIMFRFTF